MDGVVGDFWLGTVPIRTEREEGENGAERRVWADGPDGVGEPNINDPVFVIEHCRRFGAGTV